MKDKRNCKFTTGVPLGNTECDAAFSQAIFVLDEDVESAYVYTADEIATAAKTAVEFALNQGDRTAIQQILRVFSRYVRKELVPPAPICEGLASVFDMFGNGCSMDEAFGLNALERGRPKAPYTQRNRERCNAIAVCYWMVQLQTSSVRKAAGKWAEIQAIDPDAKVDSIATIQRDYAKHKQSDWLAAIRKRYEAADCKVFRIK